MAKSYTTDQWLRKASLVLSGPRLSIDLSTLRFKFQTRAYDYQSLPTLYVRVYNAAESTVKQIIAAGEFTSVVLKAGYETGKYGTIFSGTVKQYRYGRETPTETYLDIYAADSDTLNWATVSVSLPPGSTQADVQKVLIDSASSVGVGQGTTGILPSQLQGGLENGKVIMAPFPEAARNFSQNTNSVWHAHDGKVHFMSNTGYRPGEVPVLNAKTGLIGMPEATNQGIEVRCLLNPAIFPRTLVQINNKDINQVANTTAQGQSPQQADLTGLGNLQFFASTAADGYYIVGYIEHSGDTRGNPWYSDMVCLTADTAANRQAEIDLGSKYNAPVQAPFGSPGGGGVLLPGGAFTLPTEDQTP